jgi:DNA (cytosine-5)-methyltransferase 1
MKAVSLFSGCGGSDVGVIAAGFDVLMANDVLPYARDLYLANHPETDYVLGDVARVQTFPAADLLVGCYPCQGFSQGGVRDPGRKINTLYLEFARALNQIRPKAFIVENVSGMVRKNFRHLLDDQFKVFSEAGYRVKAQVLNAADFGVAHLYRRNPRGFRDGLRVSGAYAWGWPNACARLHPPCPGWYGRLAGGRVLCKRLSLVLLVSESKAGLG